MNRTSYKPKQTFGCDYCGWVGNTHNCEQIRRVGYSEVDQYGNYLPRELDSNNPLLRQ